VNTEEQNNAQASPEAQPKQKKNYFGLAISGTFWGTVQYFYNAVVMFVLSIVLVRYLGKNDYGIYVYSSWISSIVILLLNLGLSTTVQTFLPRYFFNNQITDGRLFVRKIIKVQFYLLIVGACLASGLIYYWPHFVSFEYAHLRWLIGISLFMGYLGSFNSLYSAMLSAMQRFKFLSVVGIFSITANTLSLVLLVFLKTELLAFVIVSSLLNLTTILFLALKNSDLWRPIPAMHNSISYKQIFAFSGWAYLNTLLQYIVWDKSEFFFLGKFQSSSQLAIYGLAYSFTLWLVMVIDPFMSVLINITSELVSKNDNERIHLFIKKSAKFVALLFLPAITLITWIGPILIPAVYGKALAPVSSIFPVLAFSTILVRIYAVAWATIVFHHDLKKLLVWELIVAVFNISLDLLLIPKYGFWGATIANTSTQLIGVIMFTLFVRRYDIKVFDMDVRKIFAGSGVLFGLSLLPHLLLHNAVITASIAIFVTIGFYAFAWKKLLGSDDIIFLRDMQNLFPAWLRKIIQKIIILYPRIS
jgi:O-antigen/teichoic acid export membrane protein